MARIARFAQKTGMLAAVAAGAYALTCAALFWKQRELLYRAPRRVQTPDIPTIVIPESAAGPALHGWIDNPGQPSAMIYFGGSSEPVEGRRASLAAAFPHHTRYFVPYRGFGPNRMLLSEEKAIKEDGLRTFFHVAALHQEVDVLGRSLGTGMALHVAARANVRRVGLITPYDSILAVAQLRYAWLPVKRLLREHYESWRDAKEVTSRLFVILAETDPVTPHQCWQNLRSHLQAPFGVQMVPNTNHTDIVEASLTWKALREFFENPDTTPAPEGPVTMGKNVGLAPVVS